MGGYHHTRVAVHCPWQQSDSSVQMVGCRAACSVALIRTGLLSHSRIDYGGLRWEGRGVALQTVGTLCMPAYCAVYTCAYCHVRLYM